MERLVVRMTLRLTVKRVHLDKHCPADSASVRPILFLPAAAMTSSIKQFRSRSITQMRTQPPRLYPNSSVANGTVIIVRSGSGRLFGSDK